MQLYSIGTTAPLKEQNKLCKMISIWCATVLRQTKFVLRHQKLLPVIHHTSTLLLLQHNCIQFLIILCHFLHTATYWYSHTCMLPSIFTGYLLRNIMRPIVINVTSVIKVTPVDGSNYVCAGWLWQYIFKLYNILTKTW